MSKKNRREVCDIVRQKYTNTGKYVKLADDKIEEAKKTADKIERNVLDIHNKISLLL